LAKIVDIGIYLPDRILSNEELSSLYPGWTAQKIFEKTGIQNRHIADEGETAGDMAFDAAKNLFERGNVSVSDVDFLILCTEAPDYILPPTACVLHHKLGLKKECGALDINLGCSGFVYGLSLANGLIESGAARNVLLVTSDTYSKYINEKDKSTRTIFGDAAAATLITCLNSEKNSIGPFVFGTDGAGSNNLIVEAGLFRLPKNTGTSVEFTDPSGNTRCQDDLYMNGPEIMSFTLNEVPAAIEKVLEAANLRADEIDFFVMHQANQFMLEALRKKMRIPSQKFPIYLENVGNTVSSTIPLTLQNLLFSGSQITDAKVVLCGFGVGYSWAACILRFQKEKMT
jgi:3-oxoacyl-[acyl-carrier-protein] synthase III